MRWTEDRLQLNPTSRRAGELAGRPAVTCVVGTPVQDAARRMAERDEDAILVVGAGGLVLGIVTSGDLHRRVLAEGLTSAQPIETVMSSPVVTIDADALFFDAVHVMLRERVRHLVVLDRSRPIAVLRERDLLAARSQGPLALARRIEQADSIEALAALTPARQRAVAVLSRAGLSAYELARLTAETNDLLVRRIIALVQERIGPPPVAFCWVGLGSEGRREQTLKTDQDNAIVYDDTPDDLRALAERYCESLAEQVVSGLEQCGFPRCHGEVMATNPRWRQPLSTWRRYFEDWVRRPEPEALYNAAIFFDLRPIAGERRLVDALWDDLAAWTRSAPLFAHLLLRAALNHRPPLGFLNSLVLEDRPGQRGVFHAKARGLLPVVEVARAYALSYGLIVTNTVERLLGVRDRGALGRRDADDVIAAYQFLMSLRIRHHLARLSANRPLDDDIAPDQLSRAERKALREHFIVIAEVQTFIGQQLSAGRASSGAS